MAESKTIDQISVSNKKSEKLKFPTSELESVKLNSTSFSSHYNIPFHSKSPKKMLLS
jgi:hypothetical protein